MRPAHYQTRFKYDLSPRQREVLDLIARGKTNAEIADKLGLSLDGAKWHVREILGKLNVASREEAANYWHAENRPMVRLARTLAAFTPGGGMFKIVATAGALAAVTVAVTMVVLAIRSGAAGNSPDLPPLPDSTPTGTATATAEPTQTVPATGTPEPSPSAPVATPTTSVSTPVATPATSIPTPSATPTTSVPNPPLGSTGIPALDALSSLAVADIELVAGEVAYREIACVAEGAPGEPPQCREGEAPGTIIPVIPFAQCEGSYLRPDEVANVLASFVTEPALHSVFVLNPNEANYLGSPYGVLFQSDFENAAGEIVPRAIMLASDEDGNVTGLWSGCGASAQDIFNMLAGGQVLVSS